MKHSSIIGGSSALRAIQCTASPALVQQMPAEEKSSWAREGDALHALMYSALNEEGLPKRGKSYTWHDEDGNAVMLSADVLEEKFFPVLDAVLNVIKRHNIESFDLEIQYGHHKTSGWDVFGTLDFVGRTRDNRVVIMDFKFGSGVQVFARENYQLAFYVVGLYDNDDEFIEGVNDYVFIIVQPFRGEVHVDEWETNSFWLESYRRLERDAYLRIKNKRTSFKAGKWCQFCPARAICPEQQQNLTDFVARTPTELPGQLDTVTLADLLNRWEQAKAAGQALEKYATQVGIDADIPGWKVVASYGNRQWKEEATAERQAVAILGSEAYAPQKLKSPAQLEKAFKRSGEDFSAMSDHIERPDRGGRLVRDDNPAPRIQAAQDFDLPDNIVPLLPPNGQKNK